MSVVPVKKPASDQRELIWIVYLPLLAVIPVTINLLTVEDELFQDLIFVLLNFGFALVTFRASERSVRAQARSEERVFVIATVFFILVAFGYFWEVIDLARLPR